PLHAHPDSNTYIIPSAAAIFLPLFHSILLPIFLLSLPIFLHIFRLSLLIVYSPRNRQIRRLPSVSFSSYTEDSLKNSNISRNEHEAAYFTQWTGGELECSD